ncbi:MAG: ribonuclease Y [Acidobacteria bacterium]|nr:MAG: ribonuclease Y [Acidobacteriota bacterium]
MSDAVWLALAALVGLLATPFVWLLWVRRSARRITSRARRQATRILEESERDAAARLREADLAAKEMALRVRSESEEDAKRRRSEADELQRRLEAGRDGLAREREELERRQAAVEERSREVERVGREREAAVADVDRLRRQTVTRLEQVAGLTQQQARSELMEALEGEARVEAAHLVKRIEDEAREKATREAQRIISLAIERSASDYVNETTVSVVNLPSDEMKGRIIGREGRNIRALEMATGVDLIVDDTPEAVILSGFDPFRREIARVVLERLISDGRIHPARIEEVAEKVQGEFDQRVREEGENALLELNLSGVHPELVKLLGRLRFRTSYGQNVLQHSKEVARLAATIAGELRVDVHVAKRAGLLHDIGKAVDREMEGTHLQLGIDLLRKYGESEAVVHAMACHHGDYEPETVEAVLVTAADALSAARPGARREVLESYMKRLEKLEEIAGEFEGVQKSYAIQAGREVRIIVDCKKISDEKALWLSKDVAKRIENELTYPGQIKVTVIRESRAVEFAR